MALDRDLQSIQETRQLVEKAAEAAAVLARFSQSQIDAVVAAAAQAAERHAEPLARLAVEETTYGNVPDKIQKNLFAARDVYAGIKDMKTVGIVREDAENGIVEIAVPAGVVAAIIPTTNPTSTAIYKALIALKGRNTIVMSPHPNAVRCIRESCRVMLGAASQAGAPEGCIGCLSLPTLESTEALMKHRRTAIILATGGAGLVKAAYSSGKPALGVGPGNVPAYIHSSADVRKAVADILTGKCFDNGTVCSSEQHIVADAGIADQVRFETQRQGGFFLTPEQAAAVARVLILPNFRVNAKMVGQSAERIAQEAGIAVPAQVRALVAPLEGVGRQHPLSAEKLSPVLSFHVVNDWREGMAFCRQLLEFGGMGHTMAIHATDDQVIRELALELPAFRLVVNTPAPHGSIGYSTRLFPAMSLGCGTPGGNIISDNISPLHLINIKRLAYERRPVNEAGASARPGAAVRERKPATPERIPTSMPRPRTPSPGIDRAEISRIVERFLASRGAGSAPDVTKASDHAPTGSADSALRPPSFTPVDFVSEEDVRAAVRKGEKICIGPRTIITPSARDLGEPSEVFTTAT